MISDYLIEFIYGVDDIKRNIKDGTIEMYGSRASGNSHTNYLLEWIKNKYPDIKFLKGLNSKHDPGTISALITKLGHIVFLDISNEYMHAGILLLPNKISEKQKDAIYKFANMISNYTLYIEYDFTLNDGVIDSKTIDNELDTPKEMIDKYFNEIQFNNINKKL